MTKLLSPLSGAEKEDVTDKMLDRKLFLDCAENARRDKVGAKL